MIRVLRSWANPPTRPPVSTSRMPARKIRRGPNSSDSFPAVGWAMELARYSPETRIAVWADRHMHRVGDRY